MASTFTTSLTPMLSVRNGAAAIDFYKNGFGAVVVARADAPDGGLIIAELSINGARFFVADESPQTGNVSPQTQSGTTVRIELSVEDPDAFVARAVAHGAQIIFPVADQDYGWRQGRISDPFGHQWVVGRPLN
jgi:PhnB protein